ncbi:MAG: MerR family transcriptional regulator [Chitinophagales bacterium]
MAQYSIKEVEILSGVKAHTLRIWEQRYDFLKPKRTDTNIRYYTDEQLRMILNIGTLNRNGVKISRIAEMRQDELEREVLNVYEGTKEPDIMMDSLVHSMLDFDEERFEKALSSALTRLGFEKAFMELIFPFLIRTGVLWATGSVQVVQEHFISNLIRRKILAATDSIFVKKTATTRKFVLFLPEGETHELLLLFTEFFLRKHNHEVVYIGCSLPMNELSFVIKAFKPDYLLTYITVPPAEMHVEEYLQKLSTGQGKYHVLIGGAQIETLTASLPANCTAIQSLDALVKAIK